MSDVSQQPPRRRVWPWIAAGCSLLLVAFAAFIGFVLFAASTMMRSSDPYRAALQRAQNDRRVTEALGAPVTAGMFASGSVSTENDSGTADLRIPIRGPKGKAKLYVNATRLRGRWSYTSMIVTPEQGAEIDLLNGESPSTAPPGE